MQKSSHVTRRSLIRGTGVAMANSADVTLAQADVVTSSVEDDGVAVFLEQLLQA